MRRRIAISALFLFTLSVVVYSASGTVQTPPSADCPNGAATPEQVALKDFEAVLALERDLRATPVSARSKDGEARLYPYKTPNEAPCRWFAIDCEADGWVEEWCCGTLGSCFEQCAVICERECIIIP